MKRIQCRQLFALRMRMHACLLGCYIHLIVLTTIAWYCALQRSCIAENSLAPPSYAAMFGLDGSDGEFDRKEDMWLATVRPACICHVQLSNMPWSWLHMPCTTL